jgi:hypothetical protein
MPQSWFCSFCWWFWPFGGAAGDNVVGRRQTSDRLEEIASGNFRFKSGKLLRFNAQILLCLKRGLLS